MLTFQQTILLSMFKSISTQYQYSYHNQRSVTSQINTFKLLLNSLLLDLDLIRFVDGTYVCPSSTVESDGKSSPNPDYNLWLRQDQLILHDIFASLSESVIPFVSSAKTNKVAWEKLGKLYANKSHSRIVHLRDNLAAMRCVLKPVTDFLLGIKTIADELALIGAPQFDVICSLLSFVDLVLNLKKLLLLSKPMTLRSHLKNSMTSSHDMNRT
ncbi:Uncharacterized protein Adt_21733 [Abeliophyllum distichum]|uniref:Uncharacterized protein n=1 Tax=Abeliophyllum distichum TaxID=126358 RepID=A0ABD1T073_9LAMI